MMRPQEHYNILYVMVKTYSTVMWPGDDKLDITRHLL